MGLREPRMHRIAFFGKGGGGKTTIATNVSVILAGNGLRVLHVGCDPKRDSTLRLLRKRARHTMLDAAIMRCPERAVVRSEHGIDCVEAGGPPPGVGCAGRGIILTIEQFERMRILEEGRYDVLVFDVLGDVVCGGFAAPMRQGFAGKLVIVLSDEIMSLFAANNIARMVRTYAANGACLAGVVANHRNDGAAAHEVVEHFAARLGTRILAHLRWDPEIALAERAGITVQEARPDAPTSATLRGLTDELLALEDGDVPLPKPMSDDEMDAFIRALPPL